MTAELHWAPLHSRWPKPETRKRRAAPGWNLGDTPRRLSNELDLLKVREARIEVDANLADFKKLGGGLFRDARGRSPKVLLTYLLAETGEVEFACDTYWTWQENLHAIALTLERLRLVESYGATTGHQQYRGFKRLGAGGAEMPAQADAPMEPMEAATLIARLALGSAAGDLQRDTVASMIHDDAETARLYIRKAERICHPDRGGTAADFHAVQRAKAVLQTLHVGQGAEVPA